ncbi:MAG: hypothetical protein AB8G95_01150 [Anaerolineae bacterium]
MAKTDVSQWLDFISLGMTVNVPLFWDGIRFGVTGVATDFP